VSLPILGLWALLQIFIHLPFFTLLLVLLLCPGVQAAATESPFPDISFDVFNSFVQSTFSSKISLSTVLVLLFSITENTDLLNLHARQQNPQFSYENKRESSPWMNSLARAIQRQITERKLKTLFKKKELPENLIGEESKEAMSAKLNSFANLLGLNPFGSNGKLIQKLAPISNADIQPILVLCPTSYECMDNQCQPRSLLLWTRQQQIPEVTLIKGTNIFKKVSVLTGHCPKCKALYCVDHETFGPSNARKKAYLNDAHYLKIGQSTYVDRVFSKAVLNGIYSFHASTAAYAEFWTNSFGKSCAVKLPRRHVWQTFIQESIRTVSNVLDITFETNDNLTIAELTHKAYSVLGENGGIRLSNGHACSECTQDYKATANFVPQNNDPAALLGVDENRIVPALANENAEIANVPDETMNAIPPIADAPVKMVVMDGVVMGPVHCAANNCTADLLNARGEAFCAAHVTQFGNQCRVVNCTNRKVQGTQACPQHQQDWSRHRQARTRSTLAGVRRMLNHPGENLAWNQSNERDIQPHDEDVAEVQRKNYFSPARFYCVETLCAPCGVVIAWTKFVKSESPTQILKFLKDTYPQKDTRPDYICIDKGCLVLKHCVTNGSWLEWRDTSRLIVDSYHYTNHRVEDFMCRKYCNPAPLDGSAPNLVVEAETDTGVKYLKRAFNTQVSQ